MLNLVTAAPAALPVWMVQLEVELARSHRPSLGNDGLEPMVELMYRTEGVRSAAVVPREAGLAIAIGLAAATATVALERARALTTGCARYAGLGEVSVVRADVAFEPEAGTA